MSLNCSDTFRQSSEDVEMQPLTPESSGQTSNAAGKENPTWSVDVHKYSAACDLDELRKLLFEQERGDNWRENILKLDLEGKNVLHLIADFKGCPSRARHCISAVLNYIVEQSQQDEKNRKVSSQEESTYDDIITEFKDFINARDKNGQTALHLAAKNRNEDVCSILLNHGADMYIADKRSKFVIEKLFKRVPSVISKRIETLSQDGRNECVYTDDSRTEIIMNISHIVNYPPDMSEWESMSLHDMDFLSNIRFTPENQRKNILMHPIVKTLIWLKWQSVNYNMACFRILQIFFQLLYIVFLLLAYRADCPYPTDIRYNFTWVGLNFVKGDTEQKDMSSECYFGTGSYILVYTLTAYLSVVILLEICLVIWRFYRLLHKMKNTGVRKYFRRGRFVLCKIVGIVKLIVLGIMMTTLLRVLVSSQRKINSAWLYSAAVGAAFFCYNILTLLGKFYKAYTEMLIKVLKTLVIVMLIYCPLILAFGTMFVILFPGVGAYSSAISAIIRTLIFFVGETDYQDTFFGNESKSVDQVLGMLAFGVALLLLNVALLNFIIGLTVQNFQDLREKHSETWENYNYVHELVLFEQYCSWMPRCIKRILWNNYTLFGIQKQEEPDVEQPDLLISLKKLPKALRMEIHAMNIRTKPEKEKSLRDDLLNKNKGQNTSEPAYNCICCGSTSKTIHRHEKLECTCCEQRIPKEGDVNTIRTLRQTCAKPEKTLTPVDGNPVLTNPLAGSSEMQGQPGSGCQAELTIV